MIAAHYVDAYRLAPDDADAGEIRDLAVRSLLRAAERAGSLAAPGEAERLVAAAIELTDDERERATLLEQAGQLVLADGRPGESLDRFDEAAGLLERLGDQHAVARLNARRGEALFLKDRVDEAVALMEPAYGVLREQEQDADLAALAAQYGRMLGFAGRAGESAEPLERALEISERQQLWHTLSHAMNTKGLMSLNGGRFREGHALLSGALRVALDHDEHEAALRAYFNLSYSDEMVDFHEGEHDDARPGTGAPDRRSQLGAGVPDAPRDRRRSPGRLGRGAVAGAAGVGGCDRSVRPFRAGDPGRLGACLPRRSGGRRREHGTFRHRARIGGCAGAGGLGERREPAAVGGRPVGRRRDRRARLGDGLGRHGATPSVLQDRLRELGRELVPKRRSGGGRVPSWNTSRRCRQGC